MSEERYVLITTSKFRKGVQVGVLMTGTQAQVEQKRSEVKWAGKRPQPFIIKESEVESFTAKHRTGIFKPSYVAPSQEEIRIAAEKKKSQEKFERERETAKLSTPEGQVARALLKSKYGIEAKRPTEELMSREQLEFLKAKESKARQIQTLKKQAFQTRVEQFPYEQYTVEQGGINDLELEDSVFLHDEFMISEEDDTGNPNTRLLTVREIHYSVPFQGGLIRKLILAKVIDV